MLVFVGYASAHGSTQGIAERIATRLEARRLNAITRSVDEQDDLTPYDAFVLGSAVHSGSWLPNAASFIGRNRGVLSAHPAWIFSVSSVGDDSSFFPERIGRLLRHKKEANEVAGFRHAIAFRNHRNFAGAIKRGDWPRAGHWFLKALGGKYGDHRDWAAIDRWADEIADDLISSWNLPPADAGIAHPDGQVAASHPGNR